VLGAQEQLSASRDELHQAQERCASLLKAEGDVEAENAKLKAAVEVLYFGHHYSIICEAIGKIDASFLSMLCS
jgi:hypothetical protein